MKNLCIQFQNVSKQYMLQEDRTFKELIPSLLTGKPLSKRYKALKKLSFDIYEGETVGIVGKNGAGKSTILKLIAGVTYPSTGRVKISGRVAPIIELGAGFHHELSGYENIFLNAAILGMHKQEIIGKLDSIIAFSELEEFIHVPIKKYSTGMQMRLAFAIAIHMDAPILLIDEVLAVGDRDFQKKCINYLKYIKELHNRTIIFVSHDEKSVRSFCDRALLVSHGTLVDDGDPEKIFSEYNSSHDPART